MHFLMFFVYNLDVSIKNRVKESILNSLSIANCKIHILYMVKTAPGVTYQMLMDKCMESLMDFFNFSQSYNELIAGNLIDKDEADTGTGEVLGSSEILTITAGGEAILADVWDSLNKQTTDRLIKAADELKAAMDEINSIAAFVEYTNVKLINKSKNIEIHITCDTPAEANRIADHWRKSGAKLSSDILDLL